MMNEVAIDEVEKIEDLIYEIRGKQVMLDSDLARQYDNLKVIYNNKFHDRYFILDNNIFYHCGASINRIGYKTFLLLC